MIDRKNRPLEDDYSNSTARIDAMFQQIGSPDGIAVYASQMPAAVMRKFEALSIATNPYDSATGLQSFDRHDVKRAYALGGAAGLLMSQFAYDPYVMNAEKIFMDDIVMEVPKTDDHLSKHHAIARVVFEMGAIGLDLAGDAGEQWLENCEDALIPDVRIRRMFRTSAGVVLNLADRAYEREVEVEMKADLKKFELELAGAHEIDWDDRFTTLLRTNS